MAKWLKYMLHDKESKSNTNLTTWIRWIEDFFDWIKIQTDYGTIQCCPASEHLLKYLALTAAGREQFWLCKVLHYVLKCLLHEIRAVVLSEDKAQDKAKHIVVNCYYLIFAVRFSFSMHQWIKHFWLWVWIYIAFWSLYCARCLHKNELFLTVDIENAACVFPRVIS